MTRRLREILRLLTCALVALALMPGAREVVDALAHLAHDGHLPHSEAHAEAADDESCPSSCDEDGCTPLCHHCSCCASQPGLSPREAHTVAPLFVAADARAGVRHETGPPRFGTKPPLFPPIG